MTAKIFEHKGMVGVEIDMENGKFLNDITLPGQLGCVISPEEVAITESAKAIIKQAKREEGSFAELMLTKHTDGTSSIGVLGGGKVFLGSDFTIGRDCDVSVLDEMSIIPENETPEDFIIFIEGIKES